MESNTELEPMQQQAKWFPLVSEHASCVLSSIDGLTHNGGSIDSILWLLQLIVIDIYDKAIQAPEMSVFYALFFFCSIHVV